MSFDKLGRVSTKDLHLIIISIIFFILTGFTDLQVDRSVVQIFQKYILQFNGNI